MATDAGTVGRFLRWLLALFSVGAGVVHFAVSGEHYDLSWLHGSFFAAVAWLQLAWPSASCCGRRAGSWSWGSS